MTLHKDLWGGVFFCGSVCCESVGDDDGRVEGAREGVRRVTSEQAISQALRKTGHMGSSGMNALHDLLERRRDLPFLKHDTGTDSCFAGLLLSVLQLFLEAVLFVLCGETFDFSRELEADKRAI